MNKTMMQFFEWYYTADGSLWKKLKEEAKKLTDLGITAVWLPPAYKGMKGAISEGYDVYDIYDLGEFNQKGTVRTKYGKKQEYIEAVNAAHKNGLQVYADIVLNHMGGADETERIKVRKANPENRLEYISDVMQIEAQTRFTFPGREGKHSTFKWDHHCFTGVDHAEDLNEDGVFNIVNGYNGWEEFVNNEKGNFDFLMLSDIEFRNNAVRKELKRWIKWYHNTVQFDGLLLDKIEKVKELEKLLQLRKDYAYGLQRDYFDHFNCIGWTREGIEEKKSSGCAVVMSNGCEGIKTMKIGCKHAGKIFVDYLQNHSAEITIDQCGFATFYCRAGSVSIWVEKK